MNIGIDIMGGDFAPKANLEGVLLALKEIDPIHDNLFLIGNEEMISSFFEKNPPEKHNYTIVPSSQVIKMGEQPTKALLSKPDSSISIGFEMLKEKTLDVFSGTGNTGAMVVGAISTLNLIQGVYRPCITAPLPQINGNFGLLLDVGAVSDCKPEYLFQFGLLGSLYAENVQGKHSPKIALLNIGSEEEKGSLLYQSAYKLMKKTSLFNFIGNIEANQLFSDTADVIICDGYTGNIVLKEAEAFYKIIKKFGFSNNYFDNFNYENYGGTPILGINQAVLIGHGNSTKNAVKAMLLLSKKVKEAMLTKKIKKAFDKQMSTAKLNET